MSRYPNKSMTKTYSLLLNQLQPESFLLEPEVKMTRICQYGLINYHFKKLRLTMEEIIKQKNLQIKDSHLEDRGLVNEHFRGGNLYSTA